MNLSNYQKLKDTMWELLSLYEEQLKEKVLADVVSGAGVDNMDARLLKRLAERISLSLTGREILLKDILARVTTP